MKVLAVVMEAVWTRCADVYAWLVPAVRAERDGALARATWWRARR